MRLIGARCNDVDYVGLLSEDGAIRLLAPIPRFYADVARWTAPDAVAAAPMVPVGSVRPIAPVPRTAKVLCVGLNYRAHASEAGEQVPDHPTVFGRWASTLCAPDEPVGVLVEERLDWEAELAAIVGTPAYRVSLEQASAAILGYTAFNDISARGYQMRTSQWTLGKNMDNSGPIGPVVVTTDELGPVGALHVRARVNGELVQDASCGEMIFTAEQVLAYVSGALSLEPGDVLALGTPAGVGWVRTPPRLLGPGDVVEVEIDRIGLLRTPIADAAPPRFGPTASAVAGGIRASVDG